MNQRSLTLDEDPIVLACQLSHQCLGSTRQKVANEAVGGDAGAGDHDTRLPRGGEGRGEAATACFAVQLDGDGHLPDVAVGAAEVDGVAAGAMGGAGCDTHGQRFRRLAHIPDLDATLMGGGGDRWVVGQKLMEAADDT